MATKNFKTATRRNKPIKFTIGDDDHEFTFTAPKNALVAMPLVDAEEGMEEVAAMRGTFDWLEAGLGPEDSERIKARLRDPKDDLDVDLLGEIVEWLREESAGNPTT